VSDDNSTVAADSAGVSEAPTAIRPPDHEPVETSAVAESTPSAATRSRPRWLFPVAGGSAIAIAAIAALCIILSSSGSSGSSGAKKLSDALAGVISADQALDRQSNAMSSVKQLGRTDTAARALSSAVTRAEGAVEVIQADAQTKNLVNQALTANLDYAQKVSAATRKLSPVTATAADSAAQRTKLAYAAVSARDSKVGVPPGSSFSGTKQLSALATQVGAQTSKQTLATAAIRSYVHSIDNLLNSSVGARADLSSLISEAQNGTIGINEARDRIAGVISQRISLQTQVAALDPPGPLAYSARLLSQSIAASLDDDRAIQGMINAYLDGSDPSYFISQHEEATSSATNAKRQFLTVYNRARSRYLRLSPLSLDLRY
jgi:hypothetical protein